MPPTAPDPHNALRDLKWVCESPAMTKHPDFPAQLSQRLFESAASVDWDRVNISQLQEALTNRKTHFLGNYFELLWCFGIQHFLSAKLIAQNLQIRSRKHTYGEIDFLWLDEQDNRYCHQEVAVKFYLGLNGSIQKQSSENRWFGPNYIDRFDLKLNKLVNQQIRICDTREARKHLEALGVASVKKEIVVKGYLFQPRKNVLSLPQEVNDAHLFGIWLTHSELLELEDRRACWKILPKPRWFAPAEARLNECNTFDEIRCILSRHFSGSDHRPQMLAKLVIDNDNVWKECKRYFIVANSWPYNAWRSLETD